jgi:hypothetical protein
MAGGWRTIRRLLPVMANLEVANCIHDALEHLKAWLGRTPRTPLPASKGRAKCVAFAPLDPCTRAEPHGGPCLSLQKFNIANCKAARSGSFHFTSFRALIIGTGHDISVHSGPHKGTAPTFATYRLLGVSWRAAIGCARRPGELAAPSRNLVQTS